MTVERVMQDCPSCAMFQRLAENCSIELAKAERQNKELKKLVEDLSATYVKEKIWLQNDLRDIVRKLNNMRFPLFKSKYDKPIIFPEE